MVKTKALTSLILLDLKKDLADGNKSALNNFWNKIEKSGTPLIENINSDENHKLVTFIVKANNDTKNAVIVCSLADQDDMISHNVCERIENTNVLYKSFVVTNGTQTIYTISKNN